MDNLSSNRVLRSIAILLLVAGAGASLFLMFQAGRNNKSVLLLLLFAIWVLSPFVGLLYGMIKMPRRPPLPVLVALVVSIVILSLVIYGGKLTPAGTKTAFRFLVTPLFSWIIIGICWLITRSRQT